VGDAAPQHLQQIINPVGPILRTKRLEIMDESASRPVCVLRAEGGGGRVEVMDRLGRPIAGSTGTLGWWCGQGMGHGFPRRGHRGSARERLSLPTRADRTREIPADAISRVLSAAFRFRFGSATNLGLCPEAILLTVLADSAPDQLRHRDRGIYVETLVRGSLDELWLKTQDPDLHERWDLRFTSIAFLRRESTEATRQFRYATRIGLGFHVAGKGDTTTETIGSNGERTSSLRFWSQDPKSLIAEGSGYWRYVPTDQGIRFLTWYSYRARFGAVGRAFDRAVFRPMLGWATAWSFDRLRLWIEKGIDPRLSMRMSATHAIARIVLAFVFLFHGLVPKLLSRDPLEERLFEATGVAPELAPSLVTVLGVVEVALGIALLMLLRSTKPLPLW
jgi:DoxX-like family